MSNKVELKSSDILSHIILRDRNTAEMISGTELWSEHNTLEMEIKVNGVDISAEVFRGFMEELWEQAKELVDENNFQGRVKSQVEEILQNQAFDIQNQMNELSNKLEQVNSNIKYPWE